MEKKEKSVRVYELRAKADQLKTELAQIRKGFDGVKLPENLERKFSELASLLDTIQRKTSKGIVSKSALKEIDSDLRKVTTRFDGIIESVESLSKLTKEEKMRLIPAEAKQQLADMNTRLGEYRAVIANVIKAENDLAKAQERAAKAKTKKETAEAAAVQAQKTVDGYEKIAEAIRDQAEAEKEYQEALAERKKAEKNGSVEQRIYAQVREDNARKKRDSASTAIDSTIREQGASLGIDVSELRNGEQLTAALAQATRQLTEARKAATSASQSYTNAQTQEASATAYLNSLREGDPAAIEQQVEARERLLAAIRKVNPQFRYEEDASRSAKEELQYLRNVIDGLTDEQLARLTRELENGRAGMDSFQDSADDAKKSTEELYRVTEKKEAFEMRIKQFLGMHGAVKLLRSAVRNAVQSIKELDSVMAEMSVVTDLSISDYWDQLPQYADRATELGAALTDVYKADTLFYQQGLKTNEVVAISTETIKMARVAGLDTAEATDRMTAALRGFNMELNETSAQKVADVYSKLAAITASDVNEISSAMTKTASIAASAGMEFETTAAFLSQIIETTRESAETAGTAMKTVIARFQELKKDPSEIGEVEGEIVDANQIETALRSVGVALRDSSGQFRELDDVFLELSSKWDGLDKNTQRYIATIAAGSRQQSRFIAMMSDYARTQELVSEATNSAGANQEQYQKTMESLTSKLNRLKTAWQEFTMGIFNSDLFKLGVDILTKFLEVINKATSGFDGLHGSIIKIVSVFSFFKMGSKIFEKFKPKIEGVLLDIADKFWERGVLAGENFVKGSREGVRRQTEGVQEEPKQGPVEESEEKKKGFKGFIADTPIGKAYASFSARKTAKKSLASAMKAKTDSDDALRAQQERVDKQRKDNGRAGQGEAKKLKALIKENKEKTAELEKAKEEYTKAGEESAKNMAEGFKYTAQAITNAGIAVSVFGGILGSLGFEEAGESVSWFGNLLTMVGTAASAIIPVIKTVSGVLVKGGLSAMAAWWWAVAIVAVIAALIFGIIAIANHVKNSSPEEKLKKAEEATKKSEDAANKAAEAYENLVESFDGLANKYKELENLTRGTDEWREAVASVNNEVLSLIEKYPDLIAVMDNVDGVLTLDLESETAKTILQQTENAKIYALSNVASARATATAAQMDVAYSDLSRQATGYISYGSAGGKFASQDFTETRNGVKRGKVLNSGGYGSIELFQLTREAYEKIALEFANGAAIATEDETAKYLQEELDMPIDAAEGMAAELHKDKDAIKKFGEQLTASEKSINASFSAVAENAVSMAGTFEEVPGMIVRNLVDDDVARRITEEIAGEISDINFTDTRSGSGYDVDKAEGERLQKALEATYGVGTTYDKDSKVIKSASGETIMEDVINQDLLNIVTNAEANERLINAAQSAEVITEDIVGTILKKTGQSENAEVANALRNALMNENGTELTQGDINLLSEVESLGGEAMNEIYNTLKEKYGQTFVDMFDSAYELSTETKGSITKGDEAMSSSRKKMSNMGFSDKEINKLFTNVGSGMANSIASKFEQVFKKSGPSGTKAVADAYDKLVNNIQNEEKRADVINKINNSDWESQEALLRLQHELTTEYGLSADEVETLVTEIRKQNYAVSSLTTTVKAYGEFYKATSELETALKKAAKAEYEYQEALRSGNIAGTKENIKKMFQSYAESAQKAATAKEGRKADLAKHWGEGMNKTTYGVDLSKFVKLNEDGSLDRSSLQSLLDDENVKLTDDQKKNIETWMDQYDGYYEDYIAQDEKAQEALEQIRELQDQLRDSYIDVYETAEEAIVAELQEQIDLQQEEIDATQEANNKIFNAMQEQISLQRQQNENQKKEQELSDMRNRLAYLAMDTSGANSLEMMELQKQISDAEEEYQQTLVDQQMQAMQDANEKAYEQRQRQINLAQETLEATRESKEFKEHVQSQVDAMLSAEDWEQTKLGQAIKALNTGSLGRVASDEWINSFGIQVANAAAHLDDQVIDAATKAKEDSLTAIGEIFNSTVGISEAIADIGTHLGLENARTTLMGRGFSKGFVDKLDKETMDTLIEKTSSGKDFSSMYKQAKGSAKTVLTESQYYAREVSFGRDLAYASYEEYLQDIIDNPEDRFVEDGAYGKNPNKKVYTTAPHNTDIVEWNGENYARAEDGYYVKTVETTPIYDENGNFTNTYSVNPNAKKYTKRYKVGGLADYTGLAWLDGTPSRPEYVLNADQTKAFFSIIDILEGLDAEKFSSEKSGDNYFDVDINVESLADDYDVEAVADKVRTIIYNDATYRNVNAINHIR